MKLYLGIAREIITPKVGAALYGYAPDHFSTSVNDDLTATVFYLKQDDEKALIVSLALGSISNELAEEMMSEIERNYGIPQSAQIINAIHTHSAPNTTGTYGWGDIDREYVDGILLPKLYAAVETAVKSATPVEMAIATGESKIGINRREITIENEVMLGQNPWGPYDPTMTILSFRRMDGSPYANIIHYGAHATAAGKNPEISRDWPGVMTDVLEMETGAVTAFINGPEGDVGPRLSNGRTTSDGKIDYAMRHGALAGQDAVRIYKNLGGYYVPELRTYGGVLNIPLAKRISLEEAKEAHKAYIGELTNHRAQLEKYYREVINSYEEGYVEKETREVPQNIIRLGDVCIVAFRYELFSEIGLRIKKDAPVPYVLCLSNTNGSDGYFATETELCRGGYEIKMTRTSNIQSFANNADLFIVTETLKNLKNT